MFNHAYINKQHPQVIAHPRWEQTHKHTTKNDNSYMPMKRDSGSEKFNLNDVGGVVHGSATLK